MQDVEVEGHPNTGDLLLEYGQYRNPRRWIPVRNSLPRFQQ